jgi:chromosomal replication initiation ATPase DnaA
MDTPLFVNRQYEIELFLNLLKIDAPKRLMFLQAESGLGKTALLMQYQKRILEKHFNVSVINLQRLDSPGELLGSIVQNLDPEKFPLFNKELRRGSNEGYTLAEASMTQSFCS